MELDIKAYYRILVKKLWLIGIITLLFCGATAVYDSLYSIPVYEAGTKLIVNSSEKVDGLAKPDTNQINSNIMLIDTYKEIIATPAIMDKVVAEHPEFDTTANRLMEDVKVGTTANSQIMSISIRDSTPRDAVLIVNAIAEVFKREVPQIMNVDNVTILSVAKESDHSVPVSMGLATKLVIAVLLSLMVSIGIVLIWEYLDDTVKTERDVASLLAVPVLATVNKAKKQDRRTQSTLARKNQIGESMQPKMNHQI